jgi:HNH endonuclease
MSVNDKLQYLHRVSWMIHRGQIPNGICVLHKCDTPCCVNPDHLFLGTRTDNQKDMVRKGRSCVGEKQGRSKLTKDQVVEIRKSSESPTKIARRYGVHPTHIGAIRRGLFWKHV